MNDHPHVLILGAPRSGTSILGEFFGFLPQFNYYFEPGMDWLRQTKRQFERFRFAMKNPVDLCGGDRAAAVASRTPGLACRADELLELIPNLTAVWIVRHPLDAIVSAVPGLTDGWQHHPEPPSWRELLYETPHMRAAHMWKWINSEGWRNANRLFDVELVSYRDFVLSPRPVVQRILTHVGGVEDVDDYIDVYASRVTNEAGVHEAKYQDRWSGQRINHIGRWRESLTDAQVDLLWPVVADVAEEFGYTRESE